MDRILGVAIGIATVCFVLSVIASHLQELWASFAARRATLLEAALKQMLSDPTLTANLLAHPLIQTIAFSPITSTVLPANAPRQNRPTYIPSDLFNKVLQSVLATSHGLQGTDPAALIQSLPDSPLKTRLTTLTLGLQNDARLCNAAIEKWYDDTMTRINGLYKRNTQVILLFLGLVLAIACNANLLHVANVLWTSAAARDELTAMAQVMTREVNTADKADESDKPITRDNATPADKPGSTDTPRPATQINPVRQISLSDATDKLESLPIGYTGSAGKYWREVLSGKDPIAHLGEGAYNVLGWLLTAIAISLGAPFWFDLINKFVNVRMVGQKPATQEEQRSKTL